MAFALVVAAMKFLPFALLVVVGCSFPTTSDRYACDTTGDCESGRVCEERYCIVQTVDAGPGGVVDATPIDVTPTPDADLLSPQCLATGYTFDAAAGGYYRAGSAGKSWLNAEAECAADIVGGTHLIVLSTPAEVTFMALHLGWIGLSDRTTEGTFLTVTAETGDQRPFNAGQPDNGSGSEDCVLMKSGGGLDDDQCGNSHAFMCECDGRTSTP